MKNSALIFYKIMGYEIPDSKESFFLLEESKSKKKDKAIQKLKYDKYYQYDYFSYKKKSKLLEEYVVYINRFGRLYRSLPFIRAIYLNNSLSFNGLDEHSDIDIFIICDENRIWLSRFFSVLFFHIFGIRRYKSKVRKKFCLSFIVSKDSQNLYSLTLKPYDIYFIYWIAHLVPLYVENPDEEGLIFENNKWVKNFLPNIGLGVNIFLGNKIFYGRTMFKKIIEKVLIGLIANIFEKLIKFLWLPFVVYKRRKIGVKGNDGVVIGDSVLKFYGNDIRKKVNLKYKLLT